MVSLTIADDKLPAFCSSMMDEQLRETILLLSDGPLNAEKIVDILGVTQQDSEGRLERLHSAGLVRKTCVQGGVPIFSLDFSIERLGSPYDKKIAEPLASDLSKTLHSFLESNADEVSLSCQNIGISLGRAVEQLFLSSFSLIMKDLQSEIADEDKTLSKALVDDDRKR